MTIQAVLFDLDGVLAESEQMYKAIAHDLLAELGADVDFNDPKFTGIGFHGAFALALREAGLQGDPTALSNALFPRFLADIKSLRPVPGAPEAVHEIQKRYRTAIVSSSPRLIVEPILAQLGMHFSLSVCELEDSVWTPLPPPTVR